MANQAVWFPQKEVTEQSSLYKWMRELGFDNYDELHNASITDISWFWKEAEKKTGIEWFTPYQEVVDLSKGNAWPNWFIGGEINIVHNCLERWLQNDEIANRLAIIWEREDFVREQYTYTELNDWVNEIANGLKAQGVIKGDRVIIHMPMIPEVVVAILAIIKIGAVFVPSFSGFGADPIAKRIKSAEAKMVITADGFLRSGRTIEMKKEIDEAVANVGCVERVVVVKRLGVEIPWNAEIDIDWRELESGHKACETEVMSSMDPFMVIYTSGTTGEPKGTVHNHGPATVKLSFGNGDKEKGGSEHVNFWITDMGWIMGPSHVFGSLLSASTMVLYEGSPFKPAHTRLWDLIERYRVTHLGVSPTLIRSLMQYGTEPTKAYDLSSLLMIGSTGEPWNPEPWNWLYDKVLNKQIPIINFSGGTEIGGVILTNTGMKPIAPASFNAPALGMAVAVYNAAGEVVYNEPGELVITKPWLGMTDGFWRDDQRYLETYWNVWEDVWVHGDAAIQDEAGFWTIVGRSDDTLNVAGKRLGPAEMESIIINHPSVIESAVIGIPDNIKGQVPLCFVVASENDIDENNFKTELMEMIEKRLGKSLRPKAIYLVSDLPKTKNEKIKHREIKHAFLNQQAENLDVLDNPAVVDEFIQLGKKVGKKVNN